jgi:hypothetical protein
VYRPLNFYGLESRLNILAEIEPEALFCKVYLKSAESFRDVELLEDWDRSDPSCK